MNIQKVCVVGGGRMGRQIALNAAIYGYDTTLYDVVPAVGEDVVNWANEYLAGRIAKGRLTEEQVAQTKSLFHVEHDLAKACDGVDCVIECIVEVEEIKRNFFKELSEIVSENTIIATNSSFMVSSRFVDCIKNPSRLCNMHYYNPALVMKFVEVVQGPHTSPETARAAYEFCVNTGKKPILMKKEIDGFAANRINRAIAIEAKYLVENGYLTPQEVDAACEFGLNHPMGPFRKDDFTGIDLTLDIMQRRYDETGIKPDCYDLYCQMVKENKLGRKTGHGFYDYE